MSIILNGILKLKSRPIPLVSLSNTSGKNRKVVSMNSSALLKNPPSIRLFPRFS
jgi:hypothetical protein